MKFRLITSLVAVLFATLQTVFAQSTFQNLDFESAMIIPIPGDPHMVAISNALPGWSAYGNYAGDNILYDDLSLGAPAISIQDAAGFEPVLEGNYTVYFQGSFPGGQIVPALGQVGTVPSTAHSILYFAQAPFTVTFGGQPIPTTAVGSGPNFTIFGGDISGFTNQTGELRFQGGGLLDNIVFSSQAIPEASVSALAGLGAVLLSLRLLART
jgi:hypothetical protein